MINLVECPRDAMQGIEEFIPTVKKIAYINSLLKVGFHTLDFGSFVSPKAIPQMKDTAQVLAGLNLDNTSTKLLAIVANSRGARDAAQFDEIDYMGYPFSISETFQLRNTNATIEESLSRVEKIQNICNNSNKELVIYLSMGFGNPYGDDWNVDIVQHWTKRLIDMGIKIVSLSDTIGVSEPKTIAYLYSNLIPQFPDISIGAHLHTQAHNWREKVHAAYQSGCRRFDGALKGYGGCPMAKDELTGNMAMENMVFYFEEHGEELNLNKNQLLNSLVMAAEVFPKVH